MKEEIRIEKPKVRIRKTWPLNNDFDPATKIEKIKTNYKRSDNKAEIQKALETEEKENSGPDIDWLA